MTPIAFIKYEFLSLTFKTQKIHPQTIFSNFFFHCLALFPFLEAVSDSTTNNNLIIYLKRIQIQLPIQYAAFQNGPGEPNLLKSYPCVVPFPLSMGWT